MLPRRISFATCKGGRTDSALPSLLCGHRTQRLYRPARWLLGHGLPIEEAVLLRALIDVFRETGTCPELVEELNRVVTGAELLAYRDPRVDM